MVGLPQLIEEDILNLDSALKKLLEQSEASLGLIIDRAGFLITKVGESDGYDLTTISALAANAYAATQALANLVNEPHFNSLYQQGEKLSLLVQHIDDNC